MHPMKTEQRLSPQEKIVLMRGADMRFELESTKYYIFTFVFLSNILYCTLIGYPQGLETQLVKAPFNFSSFEYGAFYASSALPNLVLPLFVGIFIDKNGFSTFLVLILSLCLIFGSVLVTFGTYYVSWWYMCLGRLFFGLGAENISLISRKLLLQIFTVEESVAAWGVYLASNRLGSLMGSWFPPYFYALTQSMTGTFLVGVLFSMALIIFLFFALILTKKTQTLNHQMSSEVELGSFELLKRFKRETTSIFWLLLALDGLNFYMFYGFSSSANSFLVHEANLDTVDASYFLMIFSTFCALFQPVVGYIFSKYGYIVLAIIIGSVINVAAFGLFMGMYGTDDSYLVLIPILILALGYSTCTTFVFSGFGLIVSPKYHGLAYGFFQNCINFGFLFGPLVFGIVKDVTKDYDSGYFWAIFEIMIAQIIIGVLGISIFILDHFTIKVLSVKKLDVE